MKNQKGINLVSLSVAVIVIIAIAGTVLYNVRTNLGVQKLKAMQTDIENLRGKVANYYLQYGALPTLNVYSGGEKQNTSIPKDSNVIKDVVENATSKEQLDTGVYYVIDLSAMENVTLTYGEDYENLKDKSAETINTLGNGTLTDVYIINSVSHNIFYVAGITYEGKTYYTQYQDEEKEKIGKSNFDIDLESRVERDSKGNINYRIDKGERAPVNRNAIYIDENENKAVIPAGFTVSGEQGESTIENGLVVRDSNENEWVWIPVSDEDLALMYEESSTGWNMLGTDVNTKYKTLGTTLGSKILNRTDPGLIEDPYYREPDVLYVYDIEQENCIQAGFENITDMANKLKDDYRDMIESLRENKGFYIGRYELGKDSSNKPQEKAGTVMNKKDWYNLYSACKSFTTEKIQSRMIWGCQWDQVCKFINKHGDKVSLDNSRTYGNYCYSEGEAAINSGTSNFNHTTGRSEVWKTNNIYDLAGNCWEWTQEAHNSNTFSYRADRGGSLYDTQNEWSVSSFSCYFPTYKSDTFSTRPVLYIK